MGAQCVWEGWRGRVARKALLLKTFPKLPKFPKFLKFPKLPKFPKFPTKKREFREFKEFRENIPAIKNDNRKGLNAPCGCALAQYLIATYSVKVYGLIAEAYSLQRDAALYA